MYSICMCMYSICMCMYSICMCMYSICMYVYVQYMWYRRRLQQDSPSFQVFEHCRGEDRHTVHHHTVLLVECAGTIVKLHHIARKHNKKGSLPQVNNILYSAHTLHSCIIYKLPSASNKAVTDLRHITQSRPLQVVALTGF